MPPPLLRAGCFQGPRLYSAPHKLSASEPPGLQQGSAASLLHQGLAGTQHKEGQGHPANHGAQKGPASSHTCHHGCTIYREKNQTRRGSRSVRSRVKVQIQVCHPQSPCPALRDFILYKYMQVLQGVLFGDGQDQYYEEICRLKLKYLKKG